jgi:hypothetical protein
MQRYADIAAECGTGVLDAQTHLNLSVYTKTKDGDFRPVIGRDGERVPKTLDAVAGVAAAVEDGIWLNGSKASRPELFGLVTGENQTLEYEITTNRTAIRIKGDYLEIRASTFVPSLEQGLTMGMSGVLAGLRHGCSELAAQGYSTPAVVPAHLSEPTKFFNKAKHLGCLRAFELAAELPDGGFVIDPHSNDQYNKEITQSLLGIDVTSAEGVVANRILLRSVQRGPDGVLTFDPEKLIANIAALPASEQSKVSWMKSGADNVAWLMNDSLRSIRQVPIQAIKGVGTFRLLRPENRHLKLRQSIVARIAFGDKVKQFSDEVYAASDAAYQEQTAGEVTERIISQAKLR